MTHFVKIWRWSVGNFRVKSIFVASLHADFVGNVTSLHADFVRKVLDVWKFVKNRFLEQTAKTGAKSVSRKAIKEMTSQTFKILDLWFLKFHRNDVLSKNDYKIHNIGNKKWIFVGDLCTIFLPYCKYIYIYIYIYIYLDYIFVISLFLSLYGDKCMTSFFKLQFLGVLYILEKNKCHIWNPVETLRSLKYMFHAKILISKFDMIWPDLDLNSIKG